jgi:hypothetical protein
MFVPQGKRPSVTPIKRKGKIIVSKGDRNAKDTELNGGRHNLLLILLFSLKYVSVFLLLCLGY